MKQQALNNRLSRLSLYDVTWAIKFSYSPNHHQLLLSPVHTSHDLKVHRHSYKFCLTIQLIPKKINARGLVLASVVLGDTMKEDLHTWCLLHALGGRLERKINETLINGKL